MSIRDTQRAQRDKSEEYFLKVAHIYVRPISNEIRTLLLTQRVFWEVQEIIGKNQRLQEYPLFNRWLATNYGVAVAIGLRRQMDGHRKSVSVLQLLRLIVCKPELVLRERFVNLYAPELRK